MRLSENMWNFIIGLFFALLSCCFLLFFNDWLIARPAVSYQEEGSIIMPSFFPTWIWGACLFFSFCQMVSAWSRVRVEQCRTEVEVYLRRDPRALVTRMAAMATLILMYYVADWLGIVLTGFLFFVLFAFFCGDRKAARPVVGGVLVSGLLYYLFVKLANVPMPLGVLDFL